MKFNQITKVLSPTGEIKEFKEGYISFGTVLPIVHNCTCNIEDKRQCENEDCFEEGDEIYITTFFNNDKKFEGVCINNETKYHLDKISDYMYEMPSSCNDLYPLLKVCNYKGITYTIDMNEDPYQNIIESLNISDDFKEIFETHKEEMLKHHISEFEEYYISLFKSRLTSFRNHVYDFSDEAGILFEALGYRHPNQNEYKYIQNSLASIVNGYIEHIALGY